MYVLSKTQRIMKIKTTYHNVHCATVPVSLTQQGGT